MDGSFGKCAIGFGWTEGLEVQAYSQVRNFNFQYNLFWFIIVVVELRNIIRESYRNPLLEKLHS